MSKKIDVESMTIEEREAYEERKRIARQIANANLRPFRKGDDRAAAAGRKSSNSKTMRRKKTIQELASIILQSELPEASKRSLGQQFKDVDPSDLTAQAAMIIGQVQSAAKGNTAAFQALMSMQEKAELKKEKEAARRTKYHMDLDDIPDTFHPLIRQVREKEVDEIVLEGGRGSAKSTVASMIIQETLKNEKLGHALCVRKVGNTLKDSCYAQEQWAIDKQGFSDEFEEKKSPLEIVSKVTGQTIYFRGADKPEKIKSIKTTFGYFAVVWFEEADQFTPGEIRSIVQSVKRGGEWILVILSYNPPKSVNNWVNVYAKTPKSGMLVHHSTYLDVPKKWLGEPFFKEAEHLKEVNFPAYEHEYLGKANGTGGAVFQNLELRTITDEEVKQFDRIFQGVDWGLAPDPYAFVRIHYDDMRETLYFIDEFVVRGYRNTQTAEEIIKRGYNDFGMICDSAEKKSVLDYRDLGLNAKPAIKGPGSVEYGMKWLEGRTIVIDQKRTPTVFEEFTKYEFERDKEGNLITGYPDKNNHTIDATRYALERYCNKRNNNA